MTLRRSLRIAVLLAILAGLALAWLAVVGVDLEAARWRGPIERAVSNALGREVRVEGPVSAHLSLWPAVTVKGLAIANPPGFAGRDFVRIGEARFLAEVLPWLRGELRVRELRVADAEVRPERRADGAANWEFARATDAPADRPAQDLPELDIHRVVLERVRVVPETGPSVELASLDAEAPRGGRVRLAAGGTIAGEQPFALALEGAALADLAAGRPWPFEALATVGDAVAAASGTVEDARGLPRVALRFGAGSPSVAATARALRVQTPALGPAAVSGTLEAARGRISLGALNGVLDGSRVSGDVAYDGSGPRPRISGALAFAVLDVLKFSAGASPSPEAAPATLAESFRELERADLDLSRLAALDVDLTLEVAYVQGAPGDLRDVRVELRSEAGRARVPLRFKLAGAVFEGEATADVTAEPPLFHARLAARESPLGGIAEVIFGAPYVDGSFRTFELALSTAGAQARELVDTLEVRGRLAGARLTYGNFEGGTPVRMTIDALALEQPRGGSLKATAAGSLLDRRLEGRFQGESIGRVIRTGGTRFSFDAASGSVRAALSGVLAVPADAAGTDLAVRLTAARAAELAPWFGFDSKSALPVRLSGNVRVRRGSTAISAGDVLIGTNAARFDFYSGSEARGQVVRLRLDAQRLDVAELQGLAPPRQGARPDGLVGIPILPADLDLQDADVELRVQRIDRATLAVTDLAFSGRLRDGTLPASPFSLRVQGVPLDGALALELGGPVPRAQVWLQGENVDVAAWLRALGFGVGGHIEATAGRLALHADVRDTTLGRAADASLLVANIEQGRLVIRDRNTKAALRVRVTEGEVRADPGEPVRARLDGRIFRAPVTLRLASGRLRDFLDGAKRMPVSLEAEGAGARLVVAGEVAPRVASPDVDLVVGVTGSTLAELRPLLRTSLPPWGPYAGAARLRISGWGYEVEDLRLSVGESVLDGRGALDTSKHPPRLDVALDAQRLQLDDFPLDEWSPADPAIEAAPEAPRSMAAQIQDGAAQTSAQVQALLDPALLRAYDAKIEIDVREVLAGRDVLGRGRVRAQVKEGGATIELAEVEIPGGSARLTARYEPRGDSLATRASVVIDRFDYGVVARRLDPSSDLSGTFSLNLYVDSDAPRLSQSLRTGSGYLDFVVWPERIYASALDLWSTNLLLAILPIIGSDPSRVNCWLGELDLTAGRLESRRLLIDTTATRVAGAGKVDLGTNGVEIRLVPRPKVPQFFALATPIEVTGTLEDFGVRVRPFDVFETVVRWAGSLVTVPIQRLTTRPPPEDGSDACALAPR